MDINALNDMSYGMYIISTKYNGKKVGCFVNTVVQITSQDPIIAISINRKNYTNEALQIDKEFAVSILSEQTDSKVIGKFGFFSSRDVDKFEDIDYKKINDIPVINENICGYLICKVIDIVSVETHNICIARILDSKKESDNTPMTYRYYHKVIKGKAPETAPTYRKVEETKEVNGMEKYKCSICGYIYDEEKEGVKFSDLPEDWTCPLCGVGKDMFKKVEV